MNKIVKGIFKALYAIIIAIIKSISVDLVLNIRDAFIYSFKPEKRKELKRSLEADKMVKLLNERLKRVERLLYSVFEDPSYAKSNKGKFDLKELKKEVK